MEQKLCPKCGAYWRCDCVIEVPEYFPIPSCQHDWVEAVGVDIDFDLGEGNQVVLCRLCGLYSVRAVA